ncbi:hypothetical protein Vretifemale_3881, partial [Volvox reticuliferus]
SYCIQTSAVHSKVSMIQKPSLKNGQKIIKDVTSKTSSVEPQQQQHRKGERSSHVQDVAKNGSGGYHQSASHGVVNGQVENGRSNLGNGSSGLAHAQQNGTHGRLNANGQLGSKPGLAANGNARPQLYNGANAARTSGKPSSHGSNGGDSKQPVAGPAAQPTTGGGRGRDSGASNDAHPNGGAAAVDYGIVATNGGFNGTAAGRPREARRRGGRGRGAAAAGPEGAPAGADTAANGNSAGGGAAGGGAPERQRERPGRPRGDRQSRGPYNEADANGGIATISSGPVSVNGARSTVEHEDVERGGQRGGRPRGRRGRGGQQAGPAEGVEAGDEVQRMLPFPQSAADGGEMQQERRIRQPRQRSFRARRPSSQTGASEWIAGENSQAAHTDGQQNAVGKHLRTEREPKQSQHQSDDAPKQKPRDAEDCERGGDEGGRGSRVRSGRRRNGGGPDAGGGGPEAATSAGAVAPTDWDGAAGGRRQRPPRPPRQAQQPYQQQSQQQLSVPARDQPRAVPVQQEADQPLAPAASHLHYQSPAAVPASSIPQVELQSAEPFTQGATHVPPPPLQPQQPQESMVHQQPQQHQYPPPPFPEGQPLLDFPHHQQLHMHHMLPQHPYPPPPDYQQQHFLQQQHQFDPAFQQFQQQLLQQHLGPPGPGAHGFMPVPYNAPGGPMGGPAPMPPAFFAPGVNAYGQMLAPLPGPNFGGAPAPSQAQETGLAPSVPTPQHIPPQEVVSNIQRLELDQPMSETAFPTRVSPASQEEELCRVAKEPNLALAPAPAAPEAAVVSAAVEPEVQVVNAPAPANDVPASEPVKNEWADRLAQQALARMNAVKSNLLSGASGLSEGVRAAAGTDDRPRSSLLARPAVYSNGSATGSGGYTISPRGGPSNSNDSESWRGYSDDRRSGGNVAGVPSETWRNCAPCNGVPSGDAANGWRASLAPTGAADAAEAWRARSRVEDPSDTHVTPPYQPPRREESPPQQTGAISIGSGRPRLNLQPRTKPLPAQLGTSPAAGGDTATVTVNGFAAAAAPGTGTTATASNARSSIFGAARPREEVLRERGVTDPERLTASNVAYANGCGAVSGAGRMGGFAGSVTSGASDEDQWQTVGKGGRSKPPPSSADVGNALLDAASDPFFTGRTTTGHGVAIVGRSIPSGRVYNAGIAQYGSGSYGKASYGSHGAGGDTYMNAYGASRGYSHANDDDEPFFKRGLPTRNDGLF